MRSRSRRGRLIGAVTAFWHMLALVDPLSASNSDLTTISMRMKPSVGCWPVTYVPTNGSNGAHWRDLCQESVLLYMRLLLSQIDFTSTIYPSIHQAIVPYPPRGMGATKVALAAGGAFGCC